MSYLSDLQWSERRSIEMSPILETIFRNYRRVPRDHRLQIEGHIDLFGIDRYGEKILVEEKYVKGVYTSIYIEDVSCTATGKQGWIHYIYPFKYPVILFWVFEDNSYVLFNLKKLQKWYRSTNKSKYPLHINNTVNQSQGYIVPIEDLATCILKRSTHCSDKQRENKI